MRRVTATVTEIEYEALKHRAAGERRSVQNMAGQLIGVGLRSSPVAPPQPPEPPAIQPRRETAAAPSRPAARGRSRGGGAKAGSARREACRHGLADCRICGTGRFAP